MKKYYIYSGEICEFDSWLNEKKGIAFIKWRGGLTLINVNDIPEAQLSLF